MVTHADVQISALLSGLSHFAQYHGLGEYATDIKGCEKLAKTDPSKAVENIHSFGFFLVEAEAPVEDSDTD
jgi:hypothetical protein